VGGDLEAAGAEPVAAPHRDAAAVDSGADRLDVIATTAPCSTAARANEKVNWSGSVVT
jgi:hypothetical protein